MRFALLCVLVFALGACEANRGVNEAIVFRQHELEHIWSTPRQIYIDALFDDPDAVFRAVFTALPRISKVYMTDGYYYFRASLADRDISGNFRVHHHDESGPPVVNFAYFDVDNPRVYRSKLLLDDDPDVSVRSISRDRVEVSYEGITRTFIDATSDARVPDPSIKLGAHERFITSVMDESGARFTLVFNTETSYFYYLLAQRPRHADEWIQIDEFRGYRVLLGQRSKFVLLYSPDNHRNLLIGVSAAQIRLNTYYDGPFDQVPPNLDIRDDIIKAYPYVEYGSGIDTHGNFLGRDGVRVAISPYQNYENLSVFIDQVRSVITSNPSFTHVYQKLCYEPKRDFDPATSIGQSKTRNWPANHFATVSYSWGNDGKQEDRDGQSGDATRGAP